ncbi:hypothetical protein J4226_05920 [Candidatus Pacearchaeota archaeon]|nr:hypothetical protein [Candidatus Pacearchaeota archaeon]
MQLKKKIIFSGVTSTIILITSIILPIIPCRTAPNIPNKIYKWAFCSLNPDKTSSLGSITEYFGHTSSLREAYLLTFIITFIAAMIFFHYTTKKRRRK